MAKKPGVKGMSRKQRAATMIAIREQQAGRSPRAISMDARQTARRTLDPETDDLFPWQKSPNRYDVQGVDSRTGTVLVNRWRCSILKDGKRVLTATSHFIKKDAQKIVDQTNKHYPEMEATLVCDAGPLKNWYPESTSPEKDKPTKKEVVPDKQEKPEGFRADNTLIDRDLAMRAHSGTSFSPEKRGEYEISEFVGEIERVHKDLMKSAKSDEERAIVDEEMEKFQKAYAQKWNAQLAAHSQIISPMITGPANFPVKRNQKRCDAYQKRFTEMMEWKGRAMGAIAKKLKVHRIEEAGGESEIMKENLAAAKEAQVRMKAVNKILRNKKTSDDEKIKRVNKEFGLSEHLIHELMTPDWGKPGYESWQLSNNNANIKRMEGRIKEMEVREATPTTEITFADGTIIDNREDDRVQIDFDEKPDDAMISKLRGSGWRWAPSLKVWQRKRTNAAMYSAKQITGAS